MTEFKGHNLIDVRTYYQDGDAWKPGKGITIRRDLIPGLKKALLAAEKADKAAPAN